MSRSRLRSLTADLSRTVRRTTATWSSSSTILQSLEGQRRQLRPRRPDFQTQLCWQSRLDKPLRVFGGGLTPVTKIPQGRVHRCKAHAGTTDALRRETEVAAVVVKEAKPRHQVGLSALALSATSRNTSEAWEFAEFVAWTSANAACRPTVMIAIEGPRRVKRTMHLFLDCVAIPEETPETPAAPEVGLRPRPRP